jgi:hypothetical protein
MAKTRRIALPSCVALVPALAVIRDEVEDAMGRFVWVRCAVSNAAGGRGGETAGPSGIGNMQVSLPGDQRNGL